MNLGRVYSTTVMHIRTFSREKAALFFTFFFPIMLMVLFGLIFQNEGNVDYTIHIQDQDGTQLSHNFTDALADWKSTVGFCGGVFLELNFGRILTIQPEVLYTMKGADTGTGKLKFQSDSMIGLPVSAWTLSRISPERVFS